MSKKYIQLKDLEVYTLARKLPRLAWEIFENLNWKDKKIIGEQFIKAIDSISANIAEGYNRYHYLDKIKFYYNSRASLAESCEHWLQLLYEKKKVNNEKYTEIKTIAKKLEIKLNNFISATHRSKCNKNLYE